MYDDTILDAPNAPLDTPEARFIAEQRIIEGSPVLHLAEDSKVRETLPLPEPERCLVAAVILQAILDAPRHSKHGASVRAFFADPDVQDMAYDLFGVYLVLTRSDSLPSGDLVDLASAHRLIGRYRRQQGSIRSLSKGYRGRTQA